MKRIVLTGGGTAGHVTPNMALVPNLLDRGYNIHYIGSYDGIEKKLIEDMGITYHGIATGKLRRYFSLRNFSDPFRVIKGFSEAKKLMKEINPDVVFSKGGFVSVPVVLAASSRKIPCVIHESDMSPGLANKICLPKATKICCNFPEAAANLPKDKAVVTGTPIRQELYEGNSAQAMKFCGFTEVRPTLLVMGGSSGALHVNEIIWSCLNELTAKFNVVHLCGKGKTNHDYDNVPNYVQFEYIKDEMKDLLAMADIVISRAGANAICELLALHKPSILIPLPLSASRGDQVLNATSFEKSGYAKMLSEETLTNESFLEAVNDMYENRDKYIATMKNANSVNATEIIVDLIDEVCGNK